MFLWEEHNAVGCRCHNLMKQSPAVFAATISILVLTIDHEWLLVCLVAIVSLKTNKEANKTCSVLKNKNMILIIVVHGNGGS